MSTPAVVVAGPPPIKQEDLHHHALEQLPGLAYCINDNPGWGKRRSPLRCSVRNIQIPATVSTLSCSCTLYPEAVVVDAKSAELVLYLFCEGALLGNNLTLRLRGDWSMGHSIRESPLCITDVKLVFYRYCNNSRISALPDLCWYCRAHSTAYLPGDGRRLGRPPSSVLPSQLSRCDPSLVVGYNE
jgi:hypothetical protein